MSESSSGSWYFVAECQDIPLREGRRVTFRDRELALFNLGKTYLAIDNRCPHQQGPLADGIVSGKSVYCPLHTWRISLESGCVLSGGEGQVKTYPVKVTDQKIYIAL